MTLVSQKAKNFISPAILPDGKIISNFNLYEYTNGQKIMLFFWPMDFTFVCPTELIELNYAYKEFKKRNISIIGISVDSVYAHNAWRNTDINQGGIGSMKFPMISDFSKEIQTFYNIEHPTLKVALRASFIIDEKRIIRYESVNDLPIGRNIPEILRIIDALQFHERFGDVCPANWNIGKKGMHPSPEGTKQYLAENFNNI
ncbi:alkyl hydroperoxide reductase [Buchnera aphidicola (Cinara tujafilina)]|uniref:Thioredoxin peroxidase n=1 Tax=Buchnera aphidicola (Cinara tujafilina) TaxID=261317 RepID=F7WZ58_9GAMM|nr:redoxin domain-containing protein [Buchnera aphidicola]AEH39712.1 alkyl hydroperoxide reductase [Buchnera aphidicola (Cinara tujafilina)]